MKNVDVKVNKGGLMTITVDTTKSFGPSSSGKTTIIATTGGAQDFDGVKVGLNVYRK
jgi:hypothetical protein